MLRPSRMMTPGRSRRSPLYWYHLICMSVFSCTNTIQVSQFRVKRNQGRFFPRVRLRFVGNGWQPQGRKALGMVRREQRTGPLQSPAIPKLRLRLPPEPAARNPPSAQPKEQHKTGTNPTKLSRTPFHRGICSICEVPGPNGFRDPAGAGMMSPLRNADRGGRTRCRRPGPVGTWTCPEVRWKGPPNAMLRIGEGSPMKCHQGVVSCHRRPRRDRGLVRPVGVRKSEPRRWGAFPVG